MVPDAETLPAYASSTLGLNISDIEELCQQKEVKAAVMKGMANSARNFNLKGFEQVS